MKRIIVSLLSLTVLIVSLSFLSGGQAATDKRKTYIEVDGVKISLSDTGINKNGFLEIKLNLDRQKQTKSPACLSAFLTVKNGTPLHILTGDI